MSFSAAVDPATNPLGLTEKSIDRGLMACLDHFRVGCGAAFVADANCLRASCDQNVVCAAATPSQIATCRSAAQTSVCAQAYGTAFDTTGGLCRGVVSASGSPALPGDGCLPTASESPLRTDAEVQSYVSRLVLAFCGP